MSIFRIFPLLFLLLIGGCQLFDFHPYSTGPLEALSESEIRTVMEKFKVQMARDGLQQLIRPDSNHDHYARFSSSVTPPYYTYVDLAYAPDDGFILKFSRTTVASQFTDEVITNIKLRTEQMISEATSKKVSLRVYVELP